MKTDQNRTKNPKSSTTENIVAVKNVLSNESNDLESPEEQNSIVKLKAAYDAGWQKKGSGRSYNSLTAHGIGIGSKNKLVIGYATRNKRCIFCEKGHPPEDHDCRLNHTGSSKSMEASMAVEIFAKNPMLKEEGVVIGTIISDDDSSTIAQLRRESEHPVEKESDKNHAVCTLSKALWALKIPSKVIDYIKYCFGCVLEKNKDNEEAVRTGLLNIVPHAFDDHSNCGTWCGYNKDPTTYLHKILPGGKGLTDENMKASLTDVLRKFAANARRLAPCGSTQGNESFHNISLSKTTKRNHYGGSESNDFRVASAVCQKNCGTSYVVSVNTKLNLSPGKHTEKYRAQKDKLRAARALSAKTVEKKRRRRQLFQQRHHTNTRAENKEGITYSSGCGFNTFVELDNSYSIRNTPIPSTSALAFFDLETTGLSKTSEIVQVSAKLGLQEFNAFIVPSHGFSPSASLVTGLSVDDGELFRNGEKMKTMPRRLALKSFIDFLTPGPVILIAHNGGRFDAPMLLNELRSLGLLQDFQSVVFGFCDTLPLLKKKLPERIKAKKSFRQSVLAEDLVGSGAADGAHDSLVDVRMLANIIESVGINNEELRSNSVTVHSVLMAQVEAAKTKVNRHDLDCLKGGVSTGMLTKMAKAGVTIDFLKKSYSDGGEDAVTMLLGED
ncbi:uncharacterized protein LOC112466488, partial [Temnothorax curvispinosus]|uniref:Uncharacterized protein LOC112466488 n=1 Tax=Temnothorax curvispinosus TaxID=300111 RepID=A0A6J1RC54_9HYME